jgi:hypothetical protein
MTIRWLFFLAFVVVVLVHGWKRLGPTVSSLATPSREAVSQETYDKIQGSYLKIEKWMTLAQVEALLGCGPSERVECVAIDECRPNFIYFDLQGEVVYLPDRGFICSWHFDDWSIDVRFFEQGVVYWTRLRPKRGTATQS